MRHFQPFIDDSNLGGGGAPPDGPNAAILAARDELAAYIRNLADELPWPGDESEIDDPYDSLLVRYQELHPEQARQGPVFEAILCLSSVEEIMLNHTLGEIEADAVVDQILQHRYEVARAVGLYNDACEERRRRLDREEESHEAEIGERREAEIRRETKETTEKQAAGAVMGIVAIRQERLCSPEELKKEVEVNPQAADRFSRNQEDLNDRYQELKNPEQAGRGPALELLKAAKDLEAGVEYNQPESSLQAMTMIMMMALELFKIAVEEYEGIISMVRGSEDDPQDDQEA